MARSRRKSKSKVNCIITEKYEGNSTVIEEMRQYAYMAKKRR